MKKNIIKILVILVFFTSNTYAFNSKLSLEIARTNKLEQVVSNIKDINNFINLYILENGKIPTSKTILQNAYVNLSFDSYLRDESISYSIDSTEYTITYTNIIPSDLSNNLNLVFTSLVNNKLNSIINANNSITLNLDFKSIKFLRTVELLKDIDSYNKITISKTEPSTSSAIASGDMWYKPNLDGGFFIYFYTSNNKWEYISNNINLFIYKDTLDELNNIKAPKGTKAYVKSSTNIDEAFEYISNGTSWLKATY